MRILLYNNLNIREIKSYPKLKGFLEAGNFYSADVKKLEPNLYSARLDRTNRVLFSLYKYQQETLILLLEYIKNHDYSKSQFLRRGVTIQKQRIPSVHSLSETTSEQQPLTHISRDSNRVHILDKVISFDPNQQEIYALGCPIIIAGSAGSGKSILMLEKMKLMEGRVLYITQSTYLSKHSRQLYYSSNYQNKLQHLSFLSFQELVESIEVPAMQPIDFQAFKKWHRHRINTTSIKNTHALFEEFRGVITGTSTTSGYLGREEYLELGVKQSICLLEDREEVYALFKKYLGHLKQKHYYDINIISYEYLSKQLPSFDYVVIDEIQDMTNIQIALILQCLVSPENFMVCGDSNQLVHPNFFSWAKIKSLFLHQDNQHATKVITRIITSNYRNSPEITSLANQVLKLKNYRFGSIDHESHYLMKASRDTQGDILLLEDGNRTINELNEKTGSSKDFAVIVLHEDHKAIAKEKFITPLIFSIQEAKGLEYQNIILYNFISHDASSFEALSKDMKAGQLNHAFEYARNKDKKDKSLEICKFYINALYVAITRAEKNLYWIEEEQNHPLLELLKLQSLSANNLSSIDYHNSSDTEWQEELSRLEAQGNSDQAQKIRDDVLKQEVPDWDVYAGAAISNLFTAALENNDKKAKLALFEYSLVYEDHQARNALVNIGFKPAHNPYAGMQILLKKYFMMYQQDQRAAIKRVIKRYGIDYRDPFNQTPLMIAAWLGKPGIITLVNYLGADPFLTNNKGLNPFQIALEQACLHHYYAQRQLAYIYDLLKPETMSIRVNNQLIKLSNKQPEFFVLNLMVALFYRILPENMVFGNGAFNGENIAASISHFPENILPQEYHDAQFIHELLMKHQVTSTHKGSYSLFYLLDDGQYILNPEIALQAEGEWLPIYEILWIDDLALGLQEDKVDFNTNVIYQNILNDYKESYKQLVHSVTAQAEY